LGILAFYSGYAIFWAIVLLFAAIYTIFIKKSKFYYVFILFTAFSIGVVNTNFHFKSTDFLREAAPQNDVVIEGTVLTIPTSSNPERTKFFMKAEKFNEVEGVNDKTVVTINDIKENYQDIKIGNKIRVKGKLRIPFAATNPSQFNYSRYLQNLDTLTTFYFEEYEIISKTDNTAWQKLLYKLNSAREAIMEKHAKNLKSPNLEIMGGIVFGNDAINPPDEIKNSFINAGLFHLLAASGLNVGLIFAIWSWLGWTLRLPRKLNIIIGMLFIVLYCAMAGFGTPVVRAAIMFECVLGAKLFKKSPDTMSMLFFAGLLMLLYDPKLIFNVSFQLSYLVTFGIALCVTPLIELASGGITKYEHDDDATLLEKLIIKFKNFPLWLLGAIIVPLVAQLWVMPLQAYYFNTFTPYSVFANVLALPFVSILSFLGFISSIIALIFAKVPQVTDIIVNSFDYILNPFLTMLCVISDWFSSLKGSLINVIQPKIWQIIYYYALLTVSTIFITVGFTKKKAVVLIVCTLLFLISFVRINNHNLEIISFDVQNADCFLIKTPENKYIFIDSGRAPFGTYSQAKAIMIEYLRDRGIKDVELLIVTHFDADHSGGALQMMENLNIKRVLTNSKADDTYTTSEILKYLQGNQINHKTPKNNEIIYSEKDLKLKAYIENENNLLNDNDFSIINLLEYKDFKMLFTGDASVEVTEKLTGGIEADVLKVAHHGAGKSVSKEFLDKIKPKYAIISTGYNIYGHPNIETVRLLNDSKSEILRTDTMGAVKFIVNDKGIKVLRFDTTKGRFVQALAQQATPRQSL